MICDKLNNSELENKEKTRNPRAIQGRFGDPTTAKLGRLECGPVPCDVSDQRSLALTYPLVIAGLDPAIHLLKTTSF
jgi:hypothetical protein